MMHPALGWNYRGRRVETGTVVYIACEGERGIAARNAAFRQERLSEDDDPPFYVLTTRLNLPDEVDALIFDIAAQIPPDPCAAIVLDTLNRSIRGSESSDEDMSAYIAAVDALRDRFKCAVVIIHHCGIDGTRPRGHTSLTGACDAQIAIKRTETGQILATLEWMKDGPEGTVLASHLDVATVGYDDNDEPITSCVIVKDDPPAPGKAKSAKPRKLPSYVHVALEALRKALDRDPKPTPANNGDITAKTVVNVELWRACYYQMTPIKEDDPADKRTRQQDFRRAQKTLQQAQLAGIWGEWCWLQP
jgi:hypothetical protein